MSRLGSLVCVCVSVCGGREAPLWACTVRLRPLFFFSFPHPRLHNDGRRHAHDEASLPTLGSIFLPHSTPSLGIRVQGLPRERIQQSCGNVFKKGCLLAATKGSTFTGHLRGASKRLEQQWDQQFLQERRREREVRCTCAQKEIEKENYCWAQAFHPPTWRS